MELQDVKSYLRVDYDDDDNLIRLMLDAVTDEMMELIAGFNPADPTNRQKMLILAYVKELYDTRGKIQTGAGQEKMRFAVQSMMTKEMLREAE